MQHILKINFTLIALLQLIVTASAIAQSNTCPLRMTVNSCLPTSRAVDTNSRRIELSNQRLQTIQLNYDLSVLNIKTRYENYLQKVADNGIMQLDRCRNSMQTAYYNLICYDYYYYNTCDYKLRSIDERFFVCKQTAQSREALSRSNLERSYSTQMQRAKVRFDYQVAAAFARIQRDQLRLDQSQTRLAFCNNCYNLFLTPKPS